MGSPHQYRSAVRFSAEGFRRLNQVTDEFRRLLKAAALEASTPTDRAVSGERIVEAARQLCESDWLSHFEACDERSGKVA